MKRRIIDLDDPESLVVIVVDDDAEGETAYLQAARDQRVVTVTLERQQVAQLAHGMLLICGELERRGLLAIEAGPALESHAVPGGPSRALLAAPPREEFRVGRLTIGWDNDSSRVVVEAFALVFDAGAGDSALAPDSEPDDQDVADDDPLGPDLLRVRLRPHLALHFARQAARLTA